MGIASLTVENGHTKGCIEDSARESDGGHSAYRTRTSHADTVKYEERRR